MRRSSSHLTYRASGAANFCSPKAKLGVRPDIGTTTGGATVENNGSGSVTLSGTAAQIDASLANASYTGNSNHYGSDTLSVVTTDTVDSTQASGSVSITVSSPVGGPDLGLLLGAGPAGALNISNVANPPFAGLATPGSSVRLSDGSTLVGTSTRGGAPISGLPEIGTSSTQVGYSRLAVRRLEGWLLARSCLWPSFETHARARSGRGGSRTHFGLRFNNRGH
jgi:hypothetical protein